MIKYEPVINCGFFSGDNPSCWDGTLFDTEEECEKWINENTDMNNFTYDELGGGVYPQEVEVFADEDEINYEDMLCSDLIQCVLEDCDKETILDCAEAFIGSCQFRDFLLDCIRGEKKH